MAAGEKVEERGGSPINKRGRKDWGARLLLQHTAARRGGEGRHSTAGDASLGRGGRNDAAAILGFFSSKKRSFVSCDLDCILRSGRFGWAFIK